VVIPALNEAANLEHAIEGVVRVLGPRAPALDIIVVDDGSTDGTKCESERLSARYPGRIRCVSHEYNRGYGAALRTGARHARGDLVTFVMADGQFNAQCVLRLLPFIDSADIVLGIREARQDPSLRLLTAATYRLLARPLLGAGYRDLNCGKLYRASALRQMDLFCEGPVIDTEILVWAKRLNLRLCAVRVPHFPRRSGRSKATNRRNLLLVWRELAKLYWTHLKRGLSG